MSTSEGSSVSIAPNVSVAMCTFNGAHYIAAQLHTMAQQTVLPGEIVVSDDGSTDGTVALLRDEWSRLCVANAILSNISFVVLENSSSLGVTHNFEQAIHATSGEVIVLADQDDIWFPQRIERSVELLTSGAGFVFGDATLIDAAGQPLGHGLFEALALKPRERNEMATDPIRVLIKRNIVTGATAAFTREIATQAMPFPAGWVHDEWLAMVAAIRGELFAITEPLIGYRQHGSNQIGVKKNTLDTRMAKLRSQGRARNARLLARITSLSSRAYKLGADSGAHKLIESSLKFQQARSRYLSNRVLRWIPVLGQVVTGRYFRVSNGPRDILRDLIQPLGKSLRQVSSLTRA